MKNGVGALLRPRYATDAVSSGEPQHERAEGMAEENASRVWIVGSGFSVPLGGPTLKTLLSGNSFVVLRNLYPVDRFPKLGDGDVEAIYKTYAAGVASSAWNDAEAFLKTLDAAANSAEAKVKDANLVLLRHLRAPAMTQSTTPVHKLAPVARRVIAAECCAFLKGADARDEEWRAYRSWGAQLDGGDSVITFNYDRVLERLAAAKRAPCLGTPRLSLERFVGTTGYDANLPDTPNVFKMHGSVDWAASDDGICQRGDENALMCDDDELLIATPGRKKRETVAARLLEIWNKAIATIERARHVVFVGYRLPETDGEALERIMRALRRNQNRDLTIHIVLGPHDSADVQRMDTLMRYVAPQRTGATLVRTQRAWAQDFMAAYEPGLLDANP